MKTLKFTPDLCLQILNGEKTSTWRLFDDKELTVGDQLGFLNKESGEKIGEGHITSIKITTLGNLTKSDWVGHETYPSEEEMYATYTTYYGDNVNPESELKIIHFSFESK